MDDELYSEHILEEARHPFGNSILENCPSENIQNHLCGDDLTLYIDLDNETVSRASFISNGCALSTAGGSLLARWLQNKNITDLKLLTPGDIYNMFGIQINPQRSNCLLLAYGALQKHLSATRVKIY